MFSFRTTFRTTFRMTFRTTFRMTIGKSFFPAFLIAHPRRIHQQQTLCTQFVPKVLIGIQLGFCKGRFLHFLKRLSRFRIIQ